MSNRWSAREWMIRTGKGLGLEFEDSISDKALRNLIDSSPATVKQMGYIEAFLKPHRMKPPQNLTFKQARDRINLIEDNLNEHAIRTMNLEPGQIRAWNDRYYMIISIYSDLKSHRMSVQEVKLTPGKGNGSATAHPIGKERTISPHWMTCVSFPVDLTAWPPPRTQVSRTHDFDDSPF